MGAQNYFLLHKRFHFPSSRWDAFEEKETSGGSASEKDTDWIKKTSVLLKVLSTVISFTVVLVAGCVSKGALFFMIAQIPMLTTNNGTKPPLKYCYENIEGGDSSTTYEVTYGEKETIAWMW